MSVSKILKTFLILTGVFLILVLFIFATDQKSSELVFNATVYYHSSCEQYIGTYSGNKDCRDNGMTSVFGFKASNWATTANSACIGATGFYIAKIEYNNTDFTTLITLISALQNYFVTHGDIPKGPFEVKTGKYIIVYRSICKY